jgi:ADP-L-glycero-D-manno-heptose 6-epimerase
MASVIFHFFNQINKDNKVKLFKGSKNFFRDFIFIEDVVDVNMSFYDSNKSGIYNCGTGKERSFYDIAEIFKKIKPDIDIEFIDFPDNLKGKYQSFTKADLKKLYDSGYKKEFTTLEDGIAKYYNCLKLTGGYLI